MPISSLTVEAIGGTAKDKGKNIFALGLLAKMFDLNVPKLTKLIERTFQRQRPEHREKRADLLSTPATAIRSENLLEDLPIC